MTNEQLELAFDFLENTGSNIFLTGRAGTGKTTFLHNLRIQSPKRMVVVAPTGVAAINAKGSTIHSFFQLPFGLFIPGTHRTGKEVRKFSKTKIKIIRSMELLVIDEISMVRADLLDAIDDVLRRFRAKHLPFGGVQLLMIGDLQQLSPVVKQEEWELLSQHYNSPYFFDSVALKQSSYRCIELNHIYRQTDRDFIELLTKVRDNRLDEKSLTLLNNRYIPDFNPDKKEGYITLASHNQIAQSINDSKLEALNGTKFTFKAEITGNFNDYPVDNELILKHGAQVMFARNDSSPLKRYVNGSIGEVTYISEDSIEVTLAGSDETIEVTPEKWENIKYTLDESTKEITEMVDGTYTQYPLKTAWAITIHKSQGLTFDRVIIDAARSFSHGQVYVALSRCRTLEGVVLSSPLRFTSIKSDPTVIYFSKEIEENPITPNQLCDDKRNYYHALLMELFDFGQIASGVSYLRRQRI
ncbi:MAG: AAA family ATPase [Rikenellaceae bacterium]